MTSAVAQLTLAGTEVPLNAAASHSRTPFTPAQREILRMLREHQAITSSEAGRIVHSHRTPPCRRCELGSCAFTSTDGADALKRLRARGLVRRVARGLWRQAAPGDTPPRIRGPKGTRSGDVVIVEGSRWEVLEIDAVYREAICRLLKGSHSIRHFRARAIERVERAHPRRSAA
jgi:hypothetical protein